MSKLEIHGRLKARLVSEDAAAKDYTIRKIELTADSNYLIPVSSVDGRQTDITFLH